MGWKFSLVVFALILIASLIGVVSAGTCLDNNDTIMKLYSGTNSHGALWNQSYTYDICCQDIFGAGNPACSITNPHACTGGKANEVLELYQPTNSHAQIKSGPLAYPVPVCYGDLTCRAVTDPTACASDEEIVVRLYQNNNSHISDASDTNYPIKICCKSGGGGGGESEAYWADMNGNQIGQTAGKQAQIGDTVLMIFKNMAGRNYDFVIKESDLVDGLDDDDIRTVTDTFGYGTDLAAKWTITQADFDKGSGSFEGDIEEFYFTVSNNKSDELWVDKNSMNNNPPTTQIDNPLYRDIYVIEEISGKTTNIPFNQTSSDPDDDLKLTWEFGDDNITSFLNIIKTGLGDTTHFYTTSGTKSIKLTASEMSPPRTITESQSATDSTEVYVYGKGVIVFAIITQPNLDQMQEISGRFVDVNASATHVVNCSYTQAECLAGAGGASCVVYNDTITKYGIYCYLMAGKQSLVEIQNKIGMEWTFDSNPNKLTGKYNDNYGDVVEFIKVFYEPGKHTLNLKAIYTL